MSPRIGLALFLPFLAMLPVFRVDSASGRVQTGILQIAAVQTPQPDPGSTPAPVPAPSPTPAPTTQPGIIAQIFKVVFSAETLAEAISEVLATAAEKEADEIEKQTMLVSSLIGEILKPPADGSFAAISTSTIPTAAALAPVLFLVRLVLHHWNRLLNNDDGLLNVFGDWLGAGFLAVSAGPFLDAVIQAGLWMAQTAVGETVTLAAQFIEATNVTGQLPPILESTGSTMFAGLIAIAAGLGGLIGVVGLAAAFAVSQAALFVLAVVGPILAVLAVVPQMRWLRGLWLKAVAVIALLPVVAGGIFKAGVSLTVYFGGGGLSDILIRLFWLWGAVGFLLSLAGILGKVTLSSGVEAAAKLGRGTREIVTIAAYALGGGPAAAAGATAAGSVSEAGGSRAAASTGVSAAASTDTSAAGPPGRAGGAFSGGVDAPLYVRDAPPVRAAPAPLSGLTPAHSVREPIEPRFPAAGPDQAALRQPHPGEAAAHEDVFADHVAAPLAYPEPPAEAARPADEDQITAKLYERGGSEAV